MRAMRKYKKACVEYLREEGEYVDLETYYDQCFSRPHDDFSYRCTCSWCISRRLWKGSSSYQQKKLWKNSPYMKYSIRQLRRQVLKEKGKAGC